ncbi:MAG: hypothetical protein AAFW82_05210 [Pseudomonadota bacterium]
MIWIRLAVLVFLRLDTRQDSFIPIFSERVVNYRAKHDEDAFTR